MRRGKQSLASCNTTAAESKPKSSLRACHGKSDTLRSEKRADKGTARLEKRRSEADNGRDLPWQAQGENAAEKASAKEPSRGAVRYRRQVRGARGRSVRDDADARKDASNAFKAALQAFGVTWERKTKPAEKVPA